MARPEVLDPMEVMQAAGVVDEWRRLVRHVDRSSYFQTPDWVLSWWEDRGRPAMDIALWWADRRLEAVACISDVRERLHHRIPLAVPVSVNAGSGRPHSADHCGWPSLPHRIGDVRAWLADRSDGRALLLRHLDPETGVPLVPDNARLVLTTACPRVSVAEDGSIRALSASFRRKLAAYRRKLERLGVSFEWTPPEQMTAGALDELFTLHESRRSLTGDSTFRREHGEALHRRLIARAAPGRGPAVVRALCGGRAVGILYGFLWRDTFAEYQCGWDRAWARESLGTVLVAESIRLAGLNGVRCFDFLRGGEAYKYRFGAADRIDETWLVPRGLAGRVLTRKYALLRAHRADPMPPPLSSPAPRA